MTMCVKRAGLVWALVLLTTTCFILTCAAPTSTNNEGEAAGEQNLAGSKEPPAVSTTPVLDEVQDTSDAPAVSNDPNDQIPSDAEKDMTEKYLYFQITKFISRRNLTLSDIRDILSDEDEGQFMFALADKLGFLSDGKHDDPHIPVIMSHRKKLIELLKKMAATKESKSPSQEEYNEGPTVSSNETPTSKEPASPIDSKKIGFEVSAGISGLGSDAIQEILSDFSFSNSFGYAVGFQLGYSPKDEHMKYLENADADELKKLKEFLQRTLESKTTSKTTPDDSINNSRNKPTPSGGGQEAIDGKGGQKQGGGRDLVNKEDGEPSSDQLSQNDNDIQNGIPPTPKKNDLALKPSAKPGPEDDVDGANEAGDVSSNAGGPGDGDNDQADKKPEEKMKDKTSPNEEDSKGEDGVHNTGRPSPNNDERTDGTVDDYDGDGDLGQWIDEAKLGIMEDEKGDGKDPKLKAGDGGEPKAVEDSNVQAKGALEGKGGSEDSGKPEAGGGNEPEGKEDSDVQAKGALDSPGDVMVEEKGGSEESSNLKAGGGNEPEGKEDSPHQPLDSDEQAKGAFDSLGDKEEEEEYDHPRSSSSFGALHFLGIFLVLGAVVVIGYLCMHNRKKLREGVATYIKDSSKRRRRAREYKPLIST